MPTLHLKRWVELAILIYTVLKAGVTIRGRITVADSVGILLTELYQVKQCSNRVKETERCKCSLEGMGFYTATFPSVSKFSIDLQMFITNATHYFKNNA